jgi:hypothetical protein
MATHFVYLPGNAGRRAFLFNSIESALRHADHFARENKSRYRVKIFAAREATSADGQLFAGDPEVDLSLPSWWHGRWVPESVVRTVTVPRAVMILRCFDSLAWYAKKIGQTLPIEYEDSCGYWAREGGTYNAINIIRKTDATLC